jgi:hypothetical protein
LVFFQVAELPNGLSSFGEMLRDSYGVQLFPLDYCDSSWLEWFVLNDWFSFGLERFLSDCFIFFWMMALPLSLGMLVRAGVTARQPRTQSTTKEDVQTVFGGGGSKVKEDRRGGPKASGTSEINALHRQKL